MKEYEEYRDTGMLGAYHPEAAVLRSSEDGGVVTVFRDTRYEITDSGLLRERDMLIRGKVFRVTSIFPDATTTTPTDKMLALIDSELEKERHSA